MKQTPNLFVKEGVNVTLSCSQINSTDNGMYWFWQRPGKTLELIVYSYVGLQTIEGQFDKMFSAERQSATLKLTLHKAQPADSALFFCAKQDAQQCRPMCKIDKN